MIGDTKAVRGRAARKSAKRAYTMVEVMAGMAVLALGATGILAIQKTTLYGNVHARNLVTASMVAQTWVERLRADALQWNSDTDFGDTLWLSQGGFGTWFVPNEQAGLGSPAADLTGADIWTTDGDPNAQAFCTHVRVAELYPNQMVRVEVRTFWSRTAQSVATECAANPNTFGDAIAQQDYGFVYLTSAVRRADTF